MYCDMNNGNYFGTAVKPIKIECVTTCVEYSDFLAHTLPLNQNLFDRMIVVTAPWDKATRKVCETHRVEYVETNRFMETHGEFRKGYGINVGLDKLSKDAWIVHMDSDIILPSHFKDVIAIADLDSTMVYGIDRAEFKSYEDCMTFTSHDRQFAKSMYVSLDEPGIPMKDIRLIAAKIELETERAASEMLQQKLAAAYRQRDRYALIAAVTGWILLLTLTAWSLREAFRG